MKKTGADIRPEKKKILVVDDEEHICELFDDFLKEQGHEPVVVKSGEEALLKTRRIQWDLVFLDLTLPYLNGWDVMRRLREMQPNVKVIITTGYTYEEIKEKGERHGVTDYLQKPFLLDDVSAVIARHC